MSSGGPKALLADAAATSRRQLREGLESSGLEVTEAESLEELMDSLLREVQLVVCDPNLVHGDCGHLMTCLAGRLADPSFKLVVVSEQRKLGTRLAALRGGALSFVQKPAHPALILRSVRHVELDAPGRILVVDDSVTYGNVLADTLSLDGHDVVLASSGRLAREYLSIERPDLALIDVFLPDLDGIELARSLRNAVVTRNLPIVILTGRESTHVRQRASEAAVSDFVAKNTPLAEIRGMVAGWLNAGRKGSGSAWRPPAAKQAGPQDLYSRVLAASGLSEMLARSLVERALLRSGVDRASLNSESLRDALPELERALSAFLAPDDARLRLHAITSLLSRES